MNKKSLHIQFDGKNNTLAILDGLTLASVANLRRIGEQYIKRCPNLVVDLEGVDHCDSSALSLLICWLRFAKQQNRQIQFINLPQQLLDIAKLSRLENILGVDNS